MAAAHATYEVADADGDDYTRVGVEEAELYANDPPVTAGVPDGREAFAVQDVGRRAILRGRTALAGLDRDFRTDRVMPVYSSPPYRLGAEVVKEVVLGPENYLG